MDTDLERHPDEDGLHLLHQRAAAGDAQAMFDLAEHYLAANRDADAREWFIGAAGLGHALAASRLAGDAHGGLGGGRGVPAGGVRESS